MHGRQGHVRPKMHAEDKMANDKLKEGIEGFSKALEDLEKMLAKRVSELAKVEIVSSRIGKAARLSGLFVCPAECSASAQLSRLRKKLASTSVPSMRQSMAGATDPIISTGGSGP